MRTVRKPKALGAVFSGGPSLAERPAPPKSQPVGFYVILRPKPPRTKMGILEVPKRTQRAQLAVCTIGQILEIGALAWKNIADVDYTKDPVASSFKIGDWVKFRKNSGQKEYYGDPGDDVLDNFIITVADSDILHKVPDESVAKFYDWVV